MLVIQLPVSSVKNPIFPAPNVLDGQFRIVNTAWNEQLADKDSDMFAELASKLETEILNVLLSNHSPEEQFNVKVTNFSPGSIVANFRISTNQFVDLSKKEVFETLDKAIRDNNGYISSTLYKLDTESLDFQRKTSKVV